GNAVAKEGLQQERSRFGLAFAGERADVIFRELRPAFGKIEAAIARKTRLNNFFKIQYRRFAARADIAQRLTPSTDQKAAEVTTCRRVTQGGNLAKEVIPLPESKIARPKMRLEGGDTERGARRGVQNLVR